MFLDKDFDSDRFGIHSFQGITYIQISVTTTKRLTQCRVWYRRADFSPDGIVPFAMEHNERHAMPWSKGGLVMDIGPSDGAVRINVATYDNTAIQFDREVQTPANLFPNLQRAGVHRLEISVIGLHGSKEVSETQYLFINWRGVGRNFATVELKPK